LRDEINAGRLPGPRLLAASPDITRARDDAATHSAPDSVVEIVTRFVAMGFDTIKITVGGEGALSREEVMAAVAVARDANVRVAAQCNDSAAIHVALDCSVNVLFHCEEADDEALERLSRSAAFHAPAIGFLVAHKHTMPFLESEYETARAAYRGLHAIAPDANVVIGGDYGFPLTPQGSNARDLHHFVNELGYSNLQALRSATSIGGALMRMRVGKLARGYLADLLLVRGDVSKDVTLLQSPTNLLMIMKGGHMHKRPTTAMACSPVVASSDAVPCATPTCALHEEALVHRRCVWPDENGNFGVHKRCFNPDDLSKVSKRCFNPDDLSLVNKRCVIIDDLSKVSKRCFNPDDLSLMNKRCIVIDDLSLVSKRCVIIDDLSQVSQRCFSPDDLLLPIKKRRICHVE
jgi:hypothetical protein